MKKPHVSIIVPTYNCPSINKDLVRLNTYLSRLQIRYEIICVVDGLSSPDDSTLKRAQLVNLPPVKIVFYATNRGKGYAVHTGFKKARGKVVGFFDAGSDIQLSSLRTALDIILSTTTDIVIGSKRHSQSKLSNVPPIRRLLSQVSHLASRILFSLPVTDTQVGLKLFRASVIRKLLPHLRINGFAFDIEILHLAIKAKYKISESPVSVAYNHHSTLKPKSIFDFLTDCLRIYFFHYDIK